MTLPAPNALRSSDMAIDFGTAAVRVAAGNEPVREHRATTAGRRALTGGAVTDLQATVELLHPMLHQARHWLGFSGIRTLACTPSDATVEEKSALADCLTRAGARAVFLSPEPLAAAIGAGLDVGAPYAKAVIDIGEGVTDCAVIRSAQIVTSHTVRVGCADLRASLRQYFLRQYQLHISEEEAERVLRAGGVGEEVSGEIELAGVRDGERCVVTVSAAAVPAALTPVRKTIAGCIETLLHDLPPALSVELIEDGIALSGGGALLRGMRELAARVARVDVRVVADPLRAVVCGARAMLPATNLLQLWK